MIGPRRRSLARLVWAAVVGLFLGALFTQLATVYLPEGATRRFLTTTVSASRGPVGVDLIAVAVGSGPLTINVNALSQVGILIGAHVVGGGL